MIRNHIILAPRTSSTQQVFPLGQQKFPVRRPGIAGKAGYQFSVSRFAGIGNIADDASNSVAGIAPLACMQGHETCGGHKGILLDCSMDMIMLQ